MGSSVQNNTRRYLKCIMICIVNEHFLEFWRNVLRNESQYVKVFSFLNLIETYLVPKN